MSARRRNSRFADATSPGEGETGLPWETLDLSTATVNDPNNLLTTGFTQNADGSIEAGFSAASAFESVSGGVTIDTGVSIASILPTAGNQNILGRTLLFRVDTLSTFGSLQVGIGAGDYANTSAVVAAGRYNFSVNGWRVNFVEWSSTFFSSLNYGDDPDISLEVNSYGVYSDSRRRMLFSAEAVPLSGGNPDLGGSNTRYNVNVGVSPTILCYFGCRGAAAGTIRARFRWQFVDLNTAPP